MDLNEELQQAYERIGRLERRLDREKGARRESEEVAERSLRRLYTRQRALDLLTRTAAVSNAARDADAAFTSVMQMIVDDYEWRVGHLLTAARDDPEVLVSTGIWVGRESDSFFSDVCNATIGARFGPGVGVPGRVMVHGPRWELQPSDLLPAREALLRGGTVFAFGVMVEARLVAVLEFMTPVPKPRDPDLIELATPMGEQLGRVIERKRAREDAERHRTELEGTVRERTSDLLKAHDRAEALARARSALFNTVTHELATPLHNALAALDNGDTTTVRSQLGLLKDRVDALLNVAAENGQDDAGGPQMCVLADAVHQICTAQESLGGPVTLAVDPTAAEEVLIDTGRLRSALDTVIAGMRLADPSAAISVRVHLAGREAVLEVRSSGHAADPSTMEVASRAISEAHGRFIESSGGVDLVLPVSRPRLRRQGTNRRILLVDDTKVTQQLASMMLAGGGLEVDLAGDGIEALERLRETQYGAVLMDIRMPRLDGLTATQQVRAGEAGPNSADIPIIAMTAEAAPGAAEAGLLAGFDAYLTKPFTKDSLLTVVGRFLPAE